jgi:hypothetical protein
MVLYIVFVSIINIPELNRVTTTAFGYFDKIIAPLGVILGLILGYPLLKRKLIDGYVTKQFEIIHENNRIVRKECLRLKEKYPVKQISKTLDQEFLVGIVEDIKRLNELAIDANPNSYKYSYLIYKSLLTFREKMPSDIPNNFHEQYYCETLSEYVFNHIEHVYRYSTSIGFVPRNGVIIEKPILISKLKKYVIDNNYYQVEGFDHSFSYQNASALLVTFFSTNIGCLDTNNGLLFQSSYKIAPTPSPFARIMHNRGIYMPLVLEGEKLFGFVPKLSFVGYNGIKSTKADSGISTQFLICHYANLSQGSFVKGCIKDKNSLSTYKDSYIGKTVLNVADIVEFDINGESVIIKIHRDKAIEYYNQIKKTLCKIMNKETLT